MTRKASLARATPELRIHGALSSSQARALGINPDDIIDFSVNINPYGPTPAMLKAIRAATIDRYPDPTATEARERIAVSAGCAAEKIVLGNGSADLLWTCARTFLRESAAVLIVEPTFSEFRAAAESVGAKVRYWRARSVGNFEFNLDEIAAQIEETGAKVVYLCNPNNPTGTWCPATDIVKLAMVFSRTRFILDQAFLSLSEHFDEEKILLPENVIAVRSFTKSHAIPGVRVAYLIASSEDAAKLEATRPMWTTSALAQAAAIAAFGDKDEKFLAESRTALLRDRVRLRKELASSLGLTPNTDLSVRQACVPTTTSFFLLKVGKATDLTRKLLDRNIYVRDCSSFKLPEYIRIGARPEKDCARLIEALKSAIADESAP